MNKHLLTVLLLLIPNDSCAFPLFSDEDDESSFKISLTELAQVDLARNLLQQVSQNRKSVVLSPLSVSTALFALYLGADGITKQRLKGVLVGSVNESVIRTNFADLLTTSIKKGNETYELGVANRFYIRQESLAKDDFSRDFQSYFGEELQSFNYYSGKERLLPEMNEWISNKTSDKITGMITANIINSLAGIFVLNAVNFRGTWEKQFSTNMTQNELFHISESESKNVSMMQLTGEFPYYDDDSIQAVKLPYKGGNDKLELLLLLPKIRFGLSSILNSVTALEFAEWTHYSESCFVTIKVPKFRVEGKMNLEESFKKIGVTNVFENADFKQITDDPISVGHLMHASFFEVDEKGTESDAVTTTDLNEEHVGKEVIQFTADQPFLFAVIKNTTTILFLGQYVS